jgi:hypothetical protein
VGDGSGDGGGDEAAAARVMVAAAKTAKAACSVEIKVREFSQPSLWLFFFARAARALIIFPRARFDNFSSRAFD